MNKHSSQLQKFAQAHGWSVSQDNVMQFLDGSCLYRIGWRDREYRNFIIAEDWQYAEVSFKVRDRRLVKHEVVYALMAVELPRKLPNVVFDSLKHQRQQFRVAFEQGQYIRLEGGFEKYFSTYFGPDYKIDDLSFITPEVMEALIAADEYDIEIIHDKLLLFGPVGNDPESQLKDMAQKLHLIRDKLLHNILTYRDERLPYDQGRLVVARAGMFLKRTYRGNVQLLVFVLRLIGAAIVGLSAWALLTSF